MTYTGTCKQCGNEFTSSRSHAEFCSGKCRAAYSREAKKPKAHETHESAQPSTEAINADTITAAIEKLTAEIVNLKALVISGQASHLYSGEKKSDLGTSLPIFTPPTEKPVVREVSDEERIKRTAANTAAALEDF